MTTQYIVFQNEFRLDACIRLSHAISTAIIDSDITDICIVLASPGGNVAQGVGIYGLLRACPKPTRCHAVANVDSISITAMLGCDLRTATSAAIFTFHPLGMNIANHHSIKFLRQGLESLAADQDRIKAIYSDRTNIVSPELDELFDGEFFHSRDWALQNGFITGYDDLIFPSSARIINAS